MNVVITLPKNLIEAIIKGEKFFEIRSKIPRYFNDTKDVVFVVQKGSKKVPLYFTITRIYSYCTYIDEELPDKFNFNSCRLFVAKKAAVSVDYINNYSKGKDYIYAWVIGYACKVSHPNELYAELKIDKNPQSFIYRDYEWRQIDFKSFVILNVDKWLSKPLKPSVERMRYLRSLSSALPSTL